MKLKELPAYLFRARQLKRVPEANLCSYCAPPIANSVVSLTTIASRLPRLHLVIRSLLVQSLPAEKVILWLNKNLETSIPSSLRRLESLRFEIRLSQESSPHRKLVEPLRDSELSNKIIITCDDDMLYPEDWLKRLYAFYQQHPNQIVAHECRKILKGENGEILPYAKWAKEAPGCSNVDTVSLGYGGVIYPPGCLPQQTVDAETYLKLAPHADDLWFKAMSIQSGTAIRRTQECEPMPIPILGSQRNALKRANIKLDGNRDQWLSIANALKISI